MSAVTEPFRSPTLASGFELPLSRDQFRRALQVGHGRAPLHVEQYGAQEVREDILEAATICKVHDPQIEGLRADWLAELCVQADLVDSIVERAASGSSWDRRQRCALLKEFASRGNGKARTALYEACVRDRESGDVFGCDEILELDGEPGLVFVARTLGRILDQDTEFWADDSLLHDFDEKHGKGQAVELLRRHALDDAAVRRFLDTVTRTDEVASGSEVRPAEPNRTSQEVLRAISTEKVILYWGTHWGRCATREDLEPITRIALSDSPPLVLENALRCLSGARTLPFEPRLLERIDHDSAGVRLFCARTLARHVDPRIRVAGLAALRSDLDVGVTLLRRNALPEDGAEIAARLHPLADPEEQHALTSSLVHLLEDNRAVREPLLALYVYECSPCMNCRSKATRFLRDANSCPSWLLAEGVRDAAEEVRGICSARAK